MSGTEGSRPRRAMTPDDADDEFWPDDTPEETGSARRWAGIDGQEADVVEADGEQADPDTDAGPETAPSPEAEEEEAPVQDAWTTAPLANPFARPGTPAAETPIDTPIPRPLLREGKADFPSEPGLGRRMGAVAVGPTPAPRRSASSSLTPPEPDEDSATVEASPSESWFAHHRTTLLWWAVSAILLAVVLGMGIFLLSQRNTTPPVESPSPSPEPSASSSSPSPEPVPEVSEENLLDEAGANLLVDGATWVVTDTATDRTEFPARAACLSADTSQINTLISLQRTVGTQEADMLAAMHQIDTFATPEAAQQVMSQRSEAIAQCAEVPAYINSSTWITGLGDAALQVTVSYQNDPAEFHSLLLVRNGRTLSMMDVVRHGEPVGAQALINAITDSVTDLCERSEGTCPGDVSVVPTFPPPAQPPGWLIPADIPRIRAGEGMWSASSPTALSLPGTSCENIPLGTEPGPSERQQRTYVLTQAEGVPERFGMDEILFTFPDEATAQEFRDTIVDNIAGCEDRLLAAEVTEGESVSGYGAGQTTISADTWEIAQSTSDDEAVTFQVMLGIAGNKVYYTLVTVTDDYRFSTEQIAALTLRAGQRVTQLQ